MHLRTATLAILCLAAISPLVGACGATLPPPTQRMADARSAERSATELGALDDPQAELSLRLAQEQIAQAQKAIAYGQNERAQSLLVRAKADAEIAIAIAREKNAKAENRRAVDDATSRAAASTAQEANK